MTYVFVGVMRDAILAVPPAVLFRLYFRYWFRLSLHAPARTCETQTLSGEPVKRYFGKMQGLQIGLSGVGLGGHRDNLDGEGIARVIEGDG
jgi:hypothetical protein